MNIMSISTEQIKRISCDLGADLCYIASIDRFENAPKGYHPRDILTDCESVIVLAMRFLKSTLYTK